MSSCCSNEVGDDTALRLAGISSEGGSGFTTGMLMSRYAYFKKLTYFSTECIYSPDGTSMASITFLLPLAVGQSGQIGCGLRR